MSSILCFLINSWISIWVALEINTLSFCCMIKTFSIEKKSLTERSIKYFIIQSISSSLLIFSCISFRFIKYILLPLAFITVVSLIIKIGSAPFHQWFVNIVKTSKWDNRTILMTWQKIAPVFLVIYQKKSFVYLFIAFSVILGSISQINKTRIIEIMALSSVFNLSWMLLAISVNSKILVMFSLIYWSSVILIIIMISKSKINKVNRENLDTSKKWIYFTVAINLAGIPPIAGFLAKWMVFREVLKLKIFLLITIFLVIRRINLFIYLRFINLILTKNFIKKQKSVTNLRNKFIKIAFIINVPPVIMLVIYRIRLQKGLFW